METKRDADIWQQVLDGDSLGFGTIWDRHRDRVYWHLLKLGTPHDDAEDLTATVFMELWRRRRSVRVVDGSLLPWLIVTAQNVNRNAARSRRRYRRFLAALPPPAPATDPAETSGLGVLTAEARQVLSRSNAIDRTLFALTVLEGFTVKDAAATAGVSESAGKMRLSRLRTRLRTALEPPSCLKEAVP